MEEELRVKQINNKMFYFQNIEQEIDDTCHNIITFQSMHGSYTAQQSIKSILVT